MANMKVVAGKFKKKSWIVDGKGKRISDKFYLYDEFNFENFVSLETSDGHYLFHRKNGRILVKKVYGYISINYITPNLVGISYESELNKHAQIYDLDGNLLLDNIDDFKPMTNGLFAVCIHGEWGFMNEKLKFEISPLWCEVTPFNNNGEAIVYFKEYKRLAVINKKGAYICSPVTYKRAGFITDELLLVRENESGLVDCNYGVITKYGKVIVPAVYDEIILRGNFLIVRRRKLRGLYDKGGNEIFECIYPEIIETDKKFIVHDFAKKEILKVKEQEK